jgi:GT2 family glycosyltransferase
MADRPVDIVISTYRRGDRIDAMIASIRQSTHANFTLWILDQSEDAQTECCVARHSAVDPRIHYQRAPLRGISPTRNSGVLLGTAPFILFTNDDCCVSPGWISALIAEFYDQKTWIVFGRVLPGERNAAAAPADDETVLAVKISEQREIYRGNRINLGFGHGHNMAVRRERFLELGGFDDLLGSGGPLGSWEERDFGYRTLRRGGQIVYTPAAVSYHNHWQNWDGVKRSYRNYGIGTGASVAKYLRCGDTVAVIILLEWLLSQGVRQALSGAIKWRRWAKVRVGLMQLIYPWVGIARSLPYSYDRENLRYRSG